MLASKVVADTFPVHADLHADLHAVENAFRERLHAEIRSLPEFLRNQQLSQQRRRLVGSSSPCVWENKVCQSDMSYFDSYIQEHADGVSKDTYDLWKKCHSHADMAACNADNNCAYATNTKQCYPGEVLMQKFMMSVYKTYMDELMDGCTGPQAVAMKEYFGCSSAPVSECSSGGKHCKLQTTKADPNTYEVSADKNSCVKVVANSTSCKLEQQPGAAQMGMGMMMGCDAGIDANNLMTDCMTEAHVKYQCAPACTDADNEAIHDETYECLAKSCKGAELFGKSQKCNHYRSKDGKSRCQADSNCEWSTAGGTEHCRAGDAVQSALLEMSWGKQCKFTESMAASRGCSEPGDEASCKSKITNDRQCEWRTETFCSGKGGNEPDKPTISSFCNTPATSMGSKMPLAYVMDESHKCMTAKTETDCAAVDIDLSEGPTKSPLPDTAVTTTSAATAVELTSILSVLSVFSGIYSMLYGA